MYIGGVRQKRVAILLFLAPAVVALVLFLLTTDCHIVGIEPA
ncbi:MAG: hypothetical protein PHU24_08040 [Sphaerochaetaceae bacterium]|nr:hypothetical protein [Sphaerochaetaceae bacterium]